MAPVASFWIFYRVGSRNELPGTTGLSHWVEHMLFKGTEAYPRGEFDKAISRAGGISNGLTTPDWTTFFETLPSERIDLAIDFESDRMSNAVFDDAETELERTVILSEREGSENSYFYMLNEEVQSAAYHQHSYRYPTIGWKSDLQTITRDDLYDHYRRWYSPRNAVAVAVGSFDTDAMLAKLEQNFGAITINDKEPVQPVPEPEQRAERRIVLRGTEPTGYYLQAFHVPAAMNADFFPLIILDAVLSGAKGMGLFGGSANSRSNRLYRALVDSDLSVGADSSYHPTIDPTLFMFFVTLAPEVEHQVIEDAIWREIGEIQRNGIRSRELDKAIKQTKAQFAYSCESVTHQAYWLGFSEVVATTQWLDEWLPSLEAVTIEDVQRVAIEYLQPQKQTVGWYVPEGASA